MIINKRMVLQAWTYYNDKYFYNELPSRPHSVIISTWHNEYGNFEALETGWLILGINKRLTIERFCGTMVHEMIHCWQWWHEFEDEHGQSFNEFIEHLEKKGVDTRYIRVLE